MIPSELVIDGMPWTVDDCDTLPEKEWGETLKTQCRILLSTDQCAAMKEATFWHELIHALFAVRDFRLHSDDKAEEMEEEVASLLGPAICSFLKDNANVEWFWEPED